MPPLVTLPLYCSPDDLFDYLGVDGAQLRVDDHRQATGQTILVESPGAAIQATTVPVAAILYPLLSGSVLEFDGAGTTAVVEARLSTVAQKGATSLTVNPLPQALPALAQARDNGVNLALAGRLVKACQYGTSQVKLYTSGRYQDSDLQTCWSVNRWATIAAAKWLAGRQSVPRPQSVQEDWEEALEELRQVNNGQLNLEDVGTRTAGWPFMSNVTVDPSYDTAKIRVEQTISELTPVQYPQFVDWSSWFWLEW